MRTVQAGRLLLLFVMLFARMAASVGTSKVCRRALDRRMKKDPRMALSQGRSLPKDAGKYTMCTEAKQTRFFLVSMDGGVPFSRESVPIELGICAPDVCGKDDVEGLFLSGMASRIFHVSNLTFFRVSNVTSTSPQLDLRSFDTGAVVASVVVGVLVLMMLVATAIHILSWQDAATSEPEPEFPAAANGVHATRGLLPAEHVPRPSIATRLTKLTVVKAFSLIGDSGTLPKLFEKTPYKPTDCLNGLRVMSMVWVILGHTFFMVKGISGYTNEGDIVLSPFNDAVAENNPLFSIIVSAQMGVDSFFYLSGFLLSHLTLKELIGNRGKLNVVAAIGMRYIRLTPSLGIAMLVYYKIWMYFASGPFAPRFQESIWSRCDGSWWSELTYTMNFLPFDSNRVCMGWTWYLGDDMIFFIVSICIMPVYYHRKLYGWMLVLVLTAASLGITTWLIVRYNLGFYIFDYHYDRYTYYAYSKPYNRSPAYFVGVVTAWIVEEMEKRGFTRIERDCNFGIGTRRYWTCAFLIWGVMLFVIFIPITDFGVNRNSWGNFANVLYLNFARPLWAACWAVITLLCYFGQLPVVDRFLAHSAWTPFARLTYGAYLLHPFVIKLAAGSSVQYYTFSSMDMAYRHVGNTFFSYSGSAILWVLVERPTMTLTSALFKKPRAAARSVQKATSELEVEGLSTSPVAGAMARAQRAGF